MARSSPLLGMVRSSGFDSIAYDLFCKEQAGMMGVAIDPKFDNNRRITVMSTSSLTAPGSNRVMRFEVSQEFDRVHNRRDIVTDIPFTAPIPAVVPKRILAGGCGSIRAWGFLYVTTGDTHNGMMPQSPTHMGGKVLRIDTESNGAPGNNAPAFFDCASMAVGSAACKASPSATAITARSLPSMGRGIRTKSKRWFPVAMVAGTRAPAWADASTARIPIAATRPTRWKAWTPPSVQPSC